MTAGGPYRDPTEAVRIAEEQKREREAELADAARRMQPVRPVWQLLALAGAAVTGSAALVFRAQPKVAIPASPAVCEAHAARYKEALPPRACIADAECSADARGGFFTALDGCVRTRRKDADLSSANGLAQQWLEAGCATAFRTCAAHGAICEAGACVEQPPAGVPRAWVRRELTGVFTVFAPDDFVERHLQERGDEGGLREFGSPRGSVSVQIYPSRPGTEFASVSVSTGGVELQRMEHDVNGSAAHMLLERTAEGTFRVLVRLARLDAPEYHGWGSPTVAISASANCKEEAACREVFSILSTLEAWQTP
jgi:hypothetical protein